MKQRHPVSIDNQAIQLRQAAHNRYSVGSRTQSPQLSQLHIETLNNLGMNLDQDTTPMIIVSPKTQLRSLAELQSHLEKIQKTQSTYEEIHRSIPTATSYMPIQIASKLYQLTGQLLSQSIPTPDTFIAQGIGKMKGVLQSVRNFLSPNRQTLQKAPLQVVFATTFSPFSQTALNAGLTLDDTSHLLEYQARKMGLHISREEALALTIQGAGYLNEMRASSHAQIHTTFYRVHNRMCQMADHFHNQLSAISQRVRVWRRASVGITQTISSIQNRIPSVALEVEHLHRQLSSRSLAEQITHIDSTNSDFLPSYSELYPETPPQQQLPLFPPLPHSSATKKIPSSKSGTKSLELVFPKFPNGSVSPAAKQNTTKDTKSDYIEDIMSWYCETTPLPEKQPKLPTSTPYYFSPPTAPKPHEYKLNPSLYIIILWCNTLPADATSDIISTYHQELIQQEILVLSNGIVEITNATEILTQKVNELTGTISTLIESISTSITLIMPTKSAITEKPGALSKTEALILNGLRSIEKRQAEIDAVSTLTDKNLLSDLLEANVTPDLVLNGMTTQNQLETIINKLIEIITLKSTIKVQLDFFENSTYLSDLKTLSNASPNQHQNAQMDSLIDILTEVKIEFEHQLLSKIESIITFPNIHNALMRHIDTQLSKIFDGTLQKEFQSLLLNLRLLKP